MPKLTDTELTNRFTYHPPTDKTRPKHEKVNDTLIAAAFILNDVCPPGRNLSLALTALEDAKMRANAAIAQDTPEEGR